MNKLFAYQSWLRVFILTILSIFLLSACFNPPMYVDTKNRINQSQEYAEQASKDGYKAAPATLTKSGAYVDTTPMSLEQPPEWLKQKVTVHGTNLPFDFFVDRIVDHTGVFVHYDNTVKRDQLLSMNYSGTIQGALDDLKVLSDYGYDLHGNTLSWSAFETKTFNIAFLPGKTSFQVGGESASSSSGSSSGSVQQTTASGLDTGGQYSRLQSATDIWADLDKSLANLISPEGKVMVSQATTTVTVRDHPENIANIEKFIQKLNQTLSQQVMLDVQVLDVSLQHGFEYGIDWNLVKDKVTLSGGGEGPVSLTNLGDSTGMILGLGKTTTTDSDGNETEVSKVTISALKQQGNISVLTQPRVVTLNNQVATINITNQQGYLASVQSFLSGSDTGSITSDITPGQVISGLILYILPKIEGNEVYLQVSMTLAGDATLQNVFTEADDGGSKIQVPSQDFQSFNQRAKVPSGNTLVLSGFKKLSDTANKTAPFGFDPVGNKGSNTVNQEMVVMITPVILGIPQ
ncbi:MAG: bfpB [Gammaproteobacteria bacterium]|nr:bfpB [Gammaproteobacteria bacterium]